MCLFNALKPVLKPVLVKTSVQTNKHINAKEPFSDRCQMTCQNYTSLEAG